MAQYEYVLQCTQQDGNDQVARSTVTEQVLPIIDSGVKIAGICLVNQDGIGVFEEDGNTQQDVPECTSATFRAFRSARPSLMLTDIATKVTVEAPGTEELPPLFGIIDIPPSPAASGPSYRIYLRPGDTVIFAEPACQVKVTVRRVDDPNGVGEIASADVQVKSSAVAEQPTSETVAGDRAAENSETEDESNGEVGGEGTLRTPGTTEGFQHEEGTAVQDTPSRPGSKPDNAVFSTAPDQQQSQDNVIERATSSRGTARESQALKEKKQPSAHEMEEDDDSQHIFKQKPRYNTYGGTPRGSRPVTPAAKTNEVSETPLDQTSAQKKLISRAVLGVIPTSTRGTSLNGQEFDEDDDVGLSKADDLGHNSGDEDSRKRKRSMVETFDGHSEASKEPTPVQEKPRGRPRKSDQGKPGATELAQDSNDTVVLGSKKPRGRPRKLDTAVEDDEMAALDGSPHPTSSGKLKRLGRKTGARSRQLADGETEHGSASPASSFESKPPTKILLSKSAHAEDKKSINWLKKNGVTIEEEVPGRRVNFICVVGIGELHTTPKLLRSLALGKRVVTDQWITDSMNADRILLVQPYIHDDLAETIENDRRKLFVGKTVFFTTTLKTSYGKAFGSVEALAIECGATRVDAGSATKGGDKSGASDIIFLGKDDGDAIAQELLNDYELPVYSKDMLIQSIIRGELLLDEEVYKVDATKAKTPARRGKR